MKEKTIKELRTDLNLTQEQFALILGVPTRTLQNWERGVSKTPLPALRLAEVIHDTTRDKI